MYGRLFVAGAVTALFLGGCRAPAPSFNAFAPFGSSRVPPPPTGAYQQAGTYYQAPSAGSSPARGTAGRTAPSTPATAPLSVPPTGSPAPNLVKPPAMGATAPAGSLPGFVGVGNSPGGSVAPVSFQTPALNSSRTASPSGASVLPPAAAGASTTTPARIQPPKPNSSQPASSTLKLNGMHVNDATRPAGTGNVLPPDPPTEISQLPPANGNRVSSLLQIVKPVGTPTAAPAGAWQSKSR